MEHFIKIISKPDNVAIVIMMILVAFFTGLAFHEALKNDRRKAQGKDLWEEVETQKLHTWPFLVRKEFLLAVFCMVGLLIWSIVLDAPLEEPANPTLSPNPAKAPWYFLGLQELLVYFDPWIAGVVLPGLIIVGLMAIPYVDINPKGNGYYTFTERKIMILSFCFGFLVLWIFLIIIGVFFRGPGWLWFWPWEPWEPNKMVAEQNVDLSQLLGISSRSTVGSIIGGAAVSLYYGLTIVLPYRYYQSRGSPALDRLGLTKYLIVAFLFWTMMAVPIKIILRLTIDLKYIWVTPWFNI